MSVGFNVEFYRYQVGTADFLYSFFSTIAYDNVEVDKISEDSEVYMKNIGMFLDICMTLMLPLLMGYSLVGETAHEIIGVIMGILLILHNYINRKWYTAIFKGKYPPLRIVQTTANILLVICFICTMLSGIMISKHIFVFLKISFAGYVMRKMHLCAANWAFVLMSFHAGMHLAAVISKIKYKKIFYTFFTMTAIYGMYAFVKRELFKYMFLKNVFVFFDSSEPYILFYLDYIFIILFFMFLGNFANIFLGR